MPDRFDDIRADAACCAREYDTDKEKDSSLTDDWKADRLQPGRYWVKNTKGGIMPDVYMANREWMYSQTEYVEEVLAPCNYDHFVELTEKAKKYDRIKINGNYPDKISKLKSRIKHLLDLQANQDKEVENLRELLKECKNIVAHDYWQEAQFSDGQVVERQNLLARINAVLGESEE